MIASFMAEAIGSSPLARGLPGGRQAHGEALPDHPRLRGVYVEHPVDGAKIRGSSPLARGLRQHNVWNNPLARDHPRLRGVYHRPGGRLEGPEGSSPLARGLRLGEWPMPGLAGIIPACAGFTTGETAAGGARRDHPRLRGVYRGGRQRDQPVVGSSPLARGLHAGDAVSQRRGGIIPACAGFTQWPGSSCRRTADHPRLRGVYWRSTAPTPKTGGSSPLARGLQTAAGGCAAFLRIIPACAGFTTTRRISAATRTDHPRLRGVYSPIRCSTPGARGIIPACAGFTRSPT